MADNKKFSTSLVKASLMELRNSQMPLPRRVRASGRWCKEYKDVINVRMGEKTVMKLGEQILRLIILSPTIYEIKQNLIMN